MPFVKGFLHVTGSGEIDNTLPPGEGGPVDPGWGISGDRPWLPGHIPPIGGTLPEPPPGVWPPINWHHPVQPLPPDSTVPPGAIWPPVEPPVIYPRPPQVGGGPATPPPPRPVAPDQPPAKFWIVAGIPGVGWRYVCVDTSLVPEPK